MDWDADFAGLPPIDLPDGRKLGECAAYILELPKKQQQGAAMAAGDGAVAASGRRRRRLAVSRAGEFLKRIAWRFGRRSATEGAGQEGGPEGEASGENAQHQLAKTTTAANANTQANARLKSVILISRGMLNQRAGTQPVP